MTQVLHSPFGQEHPYEQLPEERFPRQPLAGQPFTIGIVSRPPDAVHRIIVHRAVGDRYLPPVEATQIVNWRPTLEEGVGAEFLERMIKIDQDVWRAELTAPAVGETLTYWLEADGATQTARFTIRGEDWRDGGLTVTAADNALDTRIMPGTDVPTLAQGLPPLLGVQWLSDGGSVRRVRLRFRATAEETFLGLGERFNTLDQRGNVIDIRCYEQYKNQGKHTYFPIPFLLSSQGYGLLVESNRWMQFDLAASNAEVWTLEADVDADGCLPLIWFKGDDPLAIIGQFAKRTGPVNLPPQWAFGLWMSGNEWNSQARVEKEVRASLEHGIQPSVVVIEAWSDETTFYIWNDAQYTPRSADQTPHLSDFTFPAEGKWTDPKGMIDWLHAQGIKLLLWQIPVMKALEAPHPQHEADRTYFEQQGYGVKDPNGELHRVRPFWFRGGYLWDVTNPQAREWWLDKRRYLLEEMGIDGFKTDGGEHLWGSSTRFADGRGGDELWNQYPQLYTEAYYEFANRYRESITFSRAGFTGSQKSPAHWAGDENSNWGAFRHSIIAGLSAGISGIPFWGWDIAGFSGEIPTAELYLRGTAMATFCPIMQYHSEFNQHRLPLRDRTPWNIQERTGDDRVIAIFRSFVELRQKLMPYIWQEAQHSAATGEPMMRALKLWYPQASEYQYFFGRDLLVSPVVEPEVSTWELFLPEGKWRDLWTGQEIDGGKVITVAAPLDRIPVFVRGESGFVITA
ncbi:MAG: glycoside hydrolase family 31 [Anaerolineae bacterium]|nr:glycoside hydrolase family 31 [Anaerolineae bacterium]